jgi:hypothetical protein
LKPDEFWNITLVELVEMLEAVRKDEEDSFDGDFTLYAWQTAHLMNASGNFKKKVTVDMLTGKKPDEVKGENRVDRDEKNRTMTGLKDKFGKQST